MPKEYLFNPPPDNSIDWTQTDKEIGKAFGVHFMTVRNYRLRMGMPRNRRGCRTKGKRKPNLPSDTPVIEPRLAINVVYYTLPARYLLDTPASHEGRNKLCETISEGRALWCVLKEKYAFEDHYEITVPPNPIKIPLFDLMVAFLGAKNFKSKAKWVELALEADRKKLEEDANWSDYRI